MKTLFQLSVLRLYKNKNALESLSFKNNLVQSSLAQIQRLWETSKV